MTTRKSSGTATVGAAATLPGAGRHLAQPLPRRTHLVGDESTGSFVTRLAATNHIPLDELLAWIGNGSERPAHDPAQHSELELSPAALHRLAVLADRPAAVLQRALPTTRDPMLLAEGPGPVWRWPKWEPAARVFLVPACALCTAAQVHSAPAGTVVWTVSVTRWRVCVRHGRWLDNLREAGRTWLPLRQLPEVAAAHRDRLLLERRLSTGGRIAFADALHIAAAWWNIPALSPPAWEERHRRLGEVGSALRTAQLVSYPEVVELAQALAWRERRRLRGTTGRDGDWLEAVRERMRQWQMPEGSALFAVQQWLSRHSPTAAPPCALRPGQEDTPERPGRGRYRRLPASGPHPDAGPAMLLEDLTCLPWRHGDIPDDVELPGAWHVLGRA